MFLRVEIQKEFKNRKTEKEENKLDLRSNPVVMNTHLTGL